MQGGKHGRLCWFHRHCEVSGLEGDGTVVNEPMQHAQTSVVASNGYTSQTPRGTKEQTLHPNTQQASMTTVYLGKYLNL